MHSSKTGFIVRFLRAAAFSVFVCFIAGPAMAQIVPFAVGEWLPYTGQNLADNGLACEITSAACKAAGLVPRYEFHPWKRSEALVESGALFACLPYRSTPDRLERYLFSDTLFTSSSAILLYSGNPAVNPLDVRGIEDLRGLRVLVTVGSSALSEPLAAAGAVVSETSSMASGILMLENGRTDALVDDRSVLLYHLSQAYEDAQRRRFRLSEYAAGEITEYKLMVSPKYRNAAKLLARFNAGLARITASGQYRAILDKYAR